MMRNIEKLELDKGSKDLIFKVMALLDDIIDTKVIHAYIAGQLDLFNMLYEKEMV